MVNLDPATKASRAQEFETLQREGAAAFSGKNFASAEACFRRASQFCPTNAEAQNNLGQALAAQGKQADARAAFWRAAEIDQLFAEPLLNLGLLAAAGKDWCGAIGYYIQALTRRSNYAEAHYNWAIALEWLGEAESAISHYNLAAQFRPGYEQAINNLAVLLDDTGRHREAETWFRTGLEVAPASAGLWSGYGSNRRALGDLQAAREAYGRALELKQDFPEARWNLSLAQLAEGDFAEGWANFRYRHSADRTRTPLPEVPWRLGHWPEIIDIAGEQGLGDELFFLRFAALLAEQGTRVRYAPDAKLRSLLERTEFLELAEQADLTNPVSVVDLPYLTMSVATPPSIRLTSDPTHLDAMEAKLAAAGPGPYLGITWRAGIRQAGFLFKEIPLGDLAGAVAHWPGTLVNLQRQPADGEQVSGAADFTRYNDSLEDMLALMTLLDAVVGVSNTNMHLRSAVGGIAHVLVTHPPEYRWMADGETSPWFPEFRLYRQDADGSWASALRSLEKI